MQNAKCKMQNVNLKAKNKPFTMFM